jgi:glycosyltransferase involved in cell wall biosynthesis
MTQGPRVSVVIPSYNCAAWLPETVDSVLAQTYANTEVIVVDDGSTDDTRAVLRPYASRVRILSQPNRGVSAARNAGVIASTGALIAFLDADDVWMPTKVADQVAVLGRRPAMGVCFTNYTEFGDADVEHGFQEGGDKLSRLAREPLGDDAYLITSERLFEEFLAGGTQPCWTSTVMVRRRCLDRVGLFDERYTRPSVEDMQLWLRLSKHFAFGYIARPCARRRVRRARYYVVPDDHHRSIFGTSVDMYETLDRWLALSRRERGVVARRVAQYRLAWGYFEFSRDRLASARRQLLSSLAAAPSRRALAYLLLSLIPIPVVRWLRSLKHRLMEVTP